MKFNELQLVLVQQYIRTNILKQAQSLDVQECIFLVQCSHGSNLTSSTIQNKVGIEYCHDGRLRSRARTECSIHLAAW